MFKDETLAYFPPRTQQIQANSRGHIRGYMLKFQIISFILLSFQEFVSYINVSYSVLLYGAVYFMCVIIGDNSPADMPSVLNVPSIHLLSPLVFVLPLLHSSPPSIVSYIIFCAFSTSRLCALLLLSSSPAPLWPVGPLPCRFAAATRFDLAPLED